MAHTKALKKQVKVHPWFQVILMIISTTIIWYVLQKRITTFRSKDPVPPIIHVTPETYTHFGGFPDTVKIGLYIDQFREFSMVKNQFEFSGILWFEFNPDVLSLETLDKFVFEKGKIKYKSEPDTQLVDGKLLVRYNVRVNFNTVLSYADFPVDNHSIHLTVANHFLSPSTVLFSSSNREFVVKAKTKALGWEEIDRSVVTGFKKSELDPHDDRKTIYYPAATFTIDYIRYGIRYIISIMLPLLLLFFLTLSSLSWGDSTATSLSIGGITATIGYKFVIENLSPKTGYFMLSDYLFFLFLSANALVFFITLADRYAKRFTITQKNLALISLHIFVVSACIYLFI